MTQQQPGWPPPPPPPPPRKAGHIVGNVIAGGLLGAIVGAFAASLLNVALTGDSIGAGVLLMVTFLPIGGLAGALLGMRRGRRPRQPPRPPEDWRRRPNRIVDVCRDREQG